MGRRGDGALVREPAGAVGPRWVLHGVRAWGRGTYLKQKFRDGWGGRRQDTAAQDGRVRGTFKAWGCWFRANAVG